MSVLPHLLAHQSAVGNQWLGITTVAALVVVVVFVLAALDRITVATPGDLLLPAAVVVLVAGLGGSLGDVVADRAPYALPVLVVLALALVAASATDLDLSLTRPLGYGALGAATLAALALGPTLDGVLFTDAEALPIPDDAQVAMAILEGPDADGTTLVELTVTGGTLGPAPVAGVPADVEEGMMPRFSAGSTFLTPQPAPGTCDDGCTSATYEIEVPPAADGELPPRLRVDMFIPTGLVPFAPPIADVVDLGPAT